MQFSYQSFAGLRPILAEQLLTPSQAAVANNCRLTSGELRPLDANQSLTGINSATAIGTIFLYLGLYWFEFAGDVDIQEAPVQNDTTNRIYYTGDGIPKKTNQAEAVTGAGPYPVNYYPLAVPTPDHAPTAALGGGGTGDARDVSYVWTIVTSWSEEGLPSVASNVVSAMQGQTVSLTGMTLEWQTGQAYLVNSWVFPTVPNGFVYRCVSAGTSGGSEPAWGSVIDEDTTDGGVTWRCYKDDILTGSGAEKRIYRTNTGLETITWTLLDTIPITQTNYSDTTTDDNLESTILPSQDWDPPPDDLIGLTAMSGGFFAAFKGKDIYMTEPGYPHAWKYSESVAHNIVGLASIGNALVVATDRKPVIFVGTHPDSMTPKVLSEPKKCLSKRGIVNFPEGVLFPSSVGLEWIDGVSMRTITKDHFAKKEWQEYFPSTFKATYHDGAYYGFYSSGGNAGAIVINTKNGQITTLDLEPSAVYTEPDTDTLYFTVTALDVLLKEDGTSYPNRTNAILLEDGGYLLLE